MKLKWNDAEKLTEWYEKNHRTLPWRENRDPYRIWVSEIMLQQTRIEAVLIKYQIFMQELPDIASLAKVEDDKLMRLWEGLGYYSRARNLKKCAQVIMQEHGGEMPHTYEQLVRLPGIGPYTAGAIASIAFDEAVPAVDGNVLRILARYCLVEEDIRSAETKKILQDALLPVYAHAGVRPRSLNQGLMELGQLVCVPNGAPLCTQCPLAENCQAYAQGRTQDIPFRSALHARRQQKRTLFILRDGRRFLLHKRADNGLLAGLYEFAGIDGHLSEEDVRKKMEEKQIAIWHIKRLPDAKHIFSHIEWHMQAWEIRTDELRNLDLPEDYTAYTKEEMALAAIPSAFKTYIDYYGLRSH